MREPKHPGVSVTDLAKRYGPVEAVRGVSLDVAAGEIVGLLGPNGAGKTSILECILGLRRPDSGTVSICGVDAGSHPREAAERVGALIQSALLQDRITPREALAFFGSFHAAAAPLPGLIARFGLTEKADAPFGSLSGGQRQRLFLALAFVNDPQVVVLDEPTSGLDPASRRELHGLIRGMRDAGRAVLLSTHYLEEAQVLCDRVAVLNEGRILADASPAELIARSATASRVAIRSARSIEPARAAAFPGVVASRLDGETWVLSTKDAARTISAALAHLDAEANRIVDLQVHRPSLEDVFIELTGSAWNGPRREAG